MITKREFVEQAYEVARSIAEQSKLPPLVTVAQAALESSWGKSKLSTDACNYFGIKAHGKHAQTEMNTRECANGKTLAVKAAFAKFHSMRECFECRDNIITRSATYAEARSAMHDDERFIRALAKHWATDPKYAEKLMAMLGEVKKILQTDNA